LMCGLVRSNFCLAIFSYRSISSIGPTWGSLPTVLLTPNPRHYLLGDGLGNLLV